MDSSPVVASTAPRTAVIIASVTMNGGSRTFATSAPLARPRSVVAPTPASTDGSAPMPDNAAVMTPAAATSAPTERSIPPVRITNVIPSATSPGMLVWRRTFTRFSGVAKLP
jgi:hypothetical protein